MIIVILVLSIENRNCRSYTVRHKNDARRPHHHWFSSSSSFSCSCYSGLSPAMSLSSSEPLSPGFYTSAAAPSTLAAGVFTYEESLFYSLFLNIFLIFLIFFFLLILVIFILWSLLNISFYHVTITPGSLNFSYCRWCRYRYSMRM